MNMLGLSSSVRSAHIACYCRFFLVHYIQVLSQYRLYKADHAYFTYLMLQRYFRHLNDCKLPLVLCCEHVHPHDFVWLLLVACTILLYNQYTCGRLKAVCKSRTGVHLEKFPVVLRTLFSKRRNFKCRCLPRIPRRGKHKSLFIWTLSST
jgi:hypothetical protein